jgi:NCAIR mutase (PurE)-related protein
LNRSRLERILMQISRRELSVSDGLAQLRHLGFEDIGFAKIDHHRFLRCGQSEVIYGAGKTLKQISDIAGKIRQAGVDVIATRIEAGIGRKLKQAYRMGQYFPDARFFYLPAGRKRKPVCDPDARVVVCCAGTSDISIAEEAALTAWSMGCRVERVFDVGVAGLHRVAASLEKLYEAKVLIVVAGMEGALPSVVAGLVATPVIAVPTSVGYGAAFDGIAPLLGMLNSCAPGVVVVNIDNGFGAGVAAAMIARQSK